MASNYFDKASLVMIPDAPLEGKVLSVKPEDRSGDFNFSRGSNLAATRVDANGLIEKGRENLLLQSNQFDTTWSKSSSVTLTSGQSGYDGSNDAWTFATSALGYGVQQSFSSTGVLTFSVYAKAGSANGIRFRIDTNSDANAYCDLANGTTSSSGGIDASITSVGGGWYRCSLTHLVEGPVKVQFFVTDGSTNYSNGSIYIQDAQLEQGMVATNVIETGASTVQAGILDNLPRLDYTDSSCPALLLEPQRFNAIDSSEYGGAWSSIDSNITKTENAATSPEGVDNAVKLEGITGSGGNQIVNFGTTLLNGVNVVGKTYTGSIYIKPVNPSDVGQDITLTIQRNSGDFESLNLTFEIDSADWKRYEMTYTFTGEGAGNQVGANFKILKADTTIDDIYLWGVQLEEGEFSTSIIPTYGSSVSRVDDLFDLRDVQTNGLVTSTQGTMFFHITDIEGTAVVYNIQTPNDLSYALRFVVKPSGFLIYQRVNHVQTQLFNTNSLSLSEWKIAMSWNGTSLITSVNGTSYINTIDASIASQLDKIARVNPQAISVTTNQILVFPTQLTEAELNDLTTL